MRKSGWTRKGFKNPANAGNRLKEWICRKGACADATTCPSELGLEKDETEEVNVGMRRLLPSAVIE